MINRFEGYKWSALCAVALVWVGCGGSEEFQPSEVSGGQETETTSENNESESGGETVEEEGTPGGFPQMSSFEQGCSLDSAECGAGLVCAAQESVGACTAVPSEDTQLSSPFSQVVVEEAPNFDCIGSYPDPALSSTVTIYGVVDRFGSGLVTEDIIVRVFDAATYDPWSCESLDVEERT